MTEVDTDKTLRFFAHTADAVDISPGTLPPQSLYALCQRGASHLNNEVAAQVSAYKKTEEGAKATQSELEAFASEKRLEKLNKVQDGTLGTRTAAGPRVSGIEAISRMIAVEFLRARLKKYSARSGNKVVLPTGENTLYIMEKQMTREDLIASEMRVSKVAIETEAKRRQEVQVEGADAGDELFA